MARVVPSILMIPELANEMVVELPVNAGPPTLIVELDITTTLLS